MPARGVDTDAQRAHFGGFHVNYLPSASGTDFRAAVFPLQFSSGTSVGPDSMNFRRGRAFSS